MGKMRVMRRSRMRKQQWKEIREGVDCGDKKEVEIEKDMKIETGDGWRLR